MTTRTVELTTLGELASGEACLLHGQLLVKLGSEESGGLIMAGRPDKGEVNWYVPSLEVQPIFTGQKVKRALIALIG